MKKNLLTLVLSVLLLLFHNNRGNSQDCGFSGEADRSLGTNSCMNGCFSGYDQCENYYNNRYRDKLEELLYGSLEEMCRQWASWLFQIPIPSGGGNSECDIWSLTADIDQEYWTNLQIAINLLNRCVNTCDGGFR